MCKSLKMISDQRKLSDPFFFLFKEVLVLKSMGWLGCKSSPIFILKTPALLIFPWGGNGIMPNLNHSIPPPNFLMSMSTSCYCFTYMGFSDSLPNWRALVYGLLEHSLRASIKIKQQFVTRETGTIFSTLLSHLQDNFVSFHTWTNILQTGSVKSLRRMWRQWWCKESENSWYWHSFLHNSTVAQGIRTAISSSFYFLILQ